MNPVFRQWLLLQPDDPHRPLLQARRQKFDQVQLGEDARHPIAIDDDDGLRSTEEIQQRAGRLIG